MDPEVKKQFNILDDLCKKRFPGTKPGTYDAIRKLANTLEEKDKRDLQYVINIRNRMAHSTRDFGTDKGKDTVPFLKGLIYGLRNRSPDPINPSLENLRKRNLDQMSQMAQELATTLAKNRVFQYINKERAATSFKEVKDCYFDCKNYYDQQRYLEKKDELKRTIARLYDNAKADASLLGIFKRGRARNSLLDKKISYDNQIGKAKTVDELQKIELEARRNLRIDK